MAKISQFTTTQSYETDTTVFCRQATVAGTEDGFISANPFAIAGRDSGGPWFNSSNQVFAVSRGGNALDETDLTGYGLPITP